MPELKCWLFFLYQEAHQSKFAVEQVMRVQVKIENLAHPPDGRALDAKNLGVCACLTFPHIAASVSVLDACSMSRGNPVTGQGRWQQAN